jgi:hypothetical protein
MDQTVMNNMAAAGGEPCMGTACGGRKFYAAEDEASLNAAIDAITQQIVGEFGGGCDDSCYTNGCPNAGDVCVQGECKPNPCATVTTCAPGDYCLTDGTTPGVCAHACNTPCPQGTSCQVGQCQPDPCATASCPMGQACEGGACVPNKCGDTGCEPGLLCQSGQCVDDPCRYVTCPDPTNYQCVSGTGACVSRGLTGTGGPRMRSNGAGCHFAPGEHAGKAALLFGLCALGITIAARRRSRPRRP